ncbi:MAG: ATP cone domain-containing protein [Methanobacterium sp.]
MTKVTKVKKRKGNVEPFDPEKVRRSLEKAAVDSGYTLKGMADLNLIDEITKGIVEEAQTKGEIDTQTIRNSILNRLEAAGSSIANSWRKFEKRYKSESK